MKKLICLILTFLLLFVAVSCKKDSDNSEPNPRYTWDASQPSSYDCFTGDVLYRNETGFLLRPWEEEYRVKYGECVWVEYENNLPPISFTSEGAGAEKIIFREVKSPIFPLGPLRIMDAGLCYPIG